MPLPRPKITLAVKRSTAGCKCSPVGLTGPKFNLHQPEKSNAGLREISSLKVKERWSGKREREGGASRKRWQEAIAITQWDFLRCVYSSGVDTGPQCVCMSARFVIWIKWALHSQLYCQYYDLIFRQMPNMFSFDADLEMHYIRLYIHKIILHEEKIPNALPVLKYGSV